MDQNRAPPSPSPEWPGPRASWLILGIAYAGVALIRLRLLDMPLERDEGEYAYFGQLLLAGHAPYHGAYSMKLPGTQMVYAAFMALFGQTASGLRLGLLAVNAGTTALILLLGRRLAGNLGGLAAALAFAALSTSTALLAILGHATHFVVAAAVAGLLLLLRAVETGRLTGFLASGILLGLGVLMKQPGGVFVLLAASWLGWRRLTQGVGGSQRLLAEEGALLAGAGLPLAAVVSWVWLSGTFEPFWFWVVRYAREYSGMVGLSAGAEYLWHGVSGHLAEAWLLLGLAATGFLLAAWPRWPLKERAFVLALTVFSFVGTSAGLFYRNHYFILMLPAVSLLVGVVVRRVEERFGAGRSGRLPAVATLGLVLAGCGQVAWTQRALLFQRSPAEVSRALYGPNPFPESPEIGRYLAQHTGPADRIAVFGSEPQILFYARRQGATGYIYTYGLMEPQPFARTMQEQLAREIEEAQPAYFVWVLVRDSWARHSDSDPWVFGWAERLLARDYALAGQVLIMGPTRTEYFWDDAAARASPWDGSRIRVYRRRDLPQRPAAAL